MDLVQYKNKKLSFGFSSRSLSELTQNYQGPAYIYDLQIIRQRFLEMQKAMPKVEIYYAMKANSHPQIMKLLAELGAGADVVSGGEIKRALESGFKPSQIVYSGVGKTKHEIKAALQLGIAQINVESMPELLRILSLAQELQIKAPVALRMNPDVDIQTHPYIATGLKDNKFGMELSLLPQLREIFKSNLSYLSLKGLSLHLGSQMLEFSGFAEALDKLVPVYQDLKKEFTDLEVFDFGGGLGIFYEKQDLQQESALLQEYAQIAFAKLQPLGCRVQTEPGRWLVAHAGILLTQVQYVKTTTHKKFIILDSGMNHLMRPSLYGSYHPIWPVEQREKTELVDVVGPICESGDFFAKDRKLSEVHEGDFVVVADAGAYGYSMSNQYNLQDLPQEIIWDTGKN